MNNRKRLTLGLIFLTLTAPAVSQVDSTLEEQMSQQEFEQAGLDKLSSEELNYLNQWLRSRNAAPKAAAPARNVESSAPAPAEDKMGFKPRPEDRTTIVSRIDGEFSGWSGRTTFKLQNGQVWRQVDGKSFPHNSTNPEVRIEPKSFGTWKMYVEGLNRSVKVKRIK